MFLKEKQESVCRVDKSRFILVERRLFINVNIFINNVIALFYFYKNIFYKNIEAEICDIKILRIF